MKTIGFPISDKESEKRRVLIPDDIVHFSKHHDLLFFEKGYGEVLGIHDNEYLAIGCHCVDRKEVFDKDIICDAKIGDALYLDSLKGKTVIGWAHAVQNKQVADAIVNGKNTAYAWEDMFENGIHTFFRNNQLAGEAAILHAFLCQGLLPENRRVALIGLGNVGKGAYRMLSALGASIDVFRRQDEHLFRSTFHTYDVIVNAVLWDTKRTDHLLYEEDIPQLKKGCFIIDISCDRHGGIETSIPTSIIEPTYVYKGVTHYVVDHTPTLLFREATYSISKAMAPFIDQLIEDKVGETLLKAKIIENGVIKDQRIVDFQKSHKLI